MSNVCCTQRVRIQGNIQTVFLRETPLHFESRFFISWRCHNT